ncbi:hypothetical protein Taro_042086 [Colocasia esculenta]|uniref:Uncharacterized protein n=1 Tax=Colocasia esculenta TaxID=4460 RepID=A0A843WHH7_COLES|nr:hypothetical protein [Colocasia esculenta]
MSNPHNQTRPEIPRRFSRSTRCPRGKNAPRTPPGPRIAKKPAQQPPPAELSFSKLYSAGVP